jgi:hypothetical protein
MPLARLAISAHNETMPGRKPKTKFEPVRMKAEPEWYVRITLPHGEQIHIDESTTEAEAKSWIDDKSVTWLKSTGEAGMPKTPKRPRGALRQSPP